MDHQWQNSQTRLYFVHSMHPCLRAWQYCTLTSAFRLGHDDITNDRVLKKYNSIWVNIIYSIQDELISIVNGTGFLKLYTGMHVLCHCEKLIINSNSFDRCLGNGISHIQRQYAVTMSTTRSDQSEKILWATRFELVNSHICCQRSGTYYCGE